MLVPDTANYFFLPDLIPGLDYQVYVISENGITDQVPDRLQSLGTKLSVTFTTTDGDRQMVITDDQGVTTDDQGVTTRLSGGDTEGLNTVSVETVTTPETCS